MDHEINLLITTPLGQISFITTRQRTYGKVMFSYVSICQQGGAMWPLSMMHWTSVYRSYPFPPDMGSQGPIVLPLVTSGGHHWRPVQTCSLPEPSLVLTSSGEVHRVCASMWYASYCNLFLFLCSLLGNKTIYLFILSGKFWIRNWTQSAILHMTLKERW